MNYSPFILCFITAVVNIACCKIFSCMHFYIMYSTLLTRIVHCNCIVVLCAGCCVSLDSPERLCFPLEYILKKISPSEIKIFIYVIICKESISIIPSVDLHIMEAVTSTSRSHNYLEFAVL